MTAIVSVLVGIGLIAAALARWTRFNPVVIAALGGVPGALLCIWLTGAEIGRFDVAFVAIVFVITATAAALGAFLGWLRRDHLQRKATWRA